MELKKLLDALWSPKRRVWLILGIGFFGMLLILFSRDPSPKPQEKQAAETVAYGNEEYAQRLEEKLGGMIGEIEGVGAVKVMVTLKNSGEIVFVQEEKRNIDKQTEPASAAMDSARISEKENIEQSYVLVENENGRKQALIQTQLEPAVQGVVIVCEGAGDINVQSRVTNVVTTALNIPSTRVCVEKIRESPD